MDSGSIHTCVSGEGPTTIVFAAGAGQTSQTWSDLVVELVKVARIITFDRPGLGQSDRGAEPRTPTRIATELQRVLDGLVDEGPIILVGHSMGGLHVLRYATLFPEGIAAVVILETPPQGFEEARLTLLSSAERAQRAQALDRALTTAPRTIRLEREGVGRTGEWDFTEFPRHIPLLVVAADSQDFGELGSPAEHRTLWVQKSRQWLSLSDRAEFVVAEGSGHMVHHDRRALVAESIKQFLKADDGR